MSKQKSWDSSDTEVLVGLGVLASLVMLIAWFVLFVAVPTITWDRMCAKQWSSACEKYYGDR